MSRIAYMLADKRLRGTLIQIVAVVLVVLTIAAIVHNAATNLAASGIASGFGFLHDTAGFDVAMSLIPFGPTNTYGRVLLVGALNTLLVSALGIITATILGTLIGILRLSKNWLAARLALAYVETLRNIPLLLQILFWYAFALALPRVRHSFDLFDVIINNRGIYLPRPIFEPGAGLMVWALMIALAVWGALSAWARGRRARTGKSFPVAWAGLALVILLPFAACAAMGFPMHWQMPVFGRFNYHGGIRIIIALFALWLALSTYTASYIAEIVRSGILAVPKGQSEAASALGLKPGQTMRLVVLPQALRVIVPPLTSQYLNLVKNSSLAVAIGYPDIVQVFAGTTLNQTGQAIEVIAITMGFYLLVSLAIAITMNVYNRSIALKER